MICACLIFWYAQCADSPRVLQFLKDHIIADDEFDKRRNGPWGQRPEDPADWNDL